MTGPLTESPGTDHVSPPAAPDPPPEPIAHDAVCLGCGYNLRGLRVEGDCPECGLSIERSVRPDRLALADRAWLRRVCRGLGMMQWAINGFVLAVLGWIFSAMALMAFAPLSTIGGVSRITVLVLFAALAIGMLAAPVLAVIGAVMVTTPEPEAVDGAAPSTEGARQRQRSRGWLGVAGAGLGFTLLSASVWLPVAVPLGAIAAIVAMVGWVRTFSRWLESLGARVPDRAVAKSTRSARQVAWVMAGVTVATPGLLLWRQVVLVTGGPLPLWLRAGNQLVGLLSLTGFLGAICVLGVASALTRAMRQIRRGARPLLTEAERFPGATEVETGDLV